MPAMAFDDEQHLPVILADVQRIDHHGAVGRESRGALVERGEQEGRGRTGMARQRRLRIARAREAQGRQKDDPPVHASPLSPPL
jgi:hypothetical protein